MLKVSVTSRGPLRDCFNDSERQEFLIFFRDGYVQVLSLADTLALVLREKRTAPR